MGLRRNICARGIETLRSPLLGYFANPQGLYEALTYGLCNASCLGASQSPRAFAKPLTYGFHRAPYLWAF